MQTVLIVDDDPTQRRLLESVVSRAGYTAVAVDSGRKAVELMSTPGGEEIDIMLLDLVMPEMDGMAVLESIRPQRSDLPVIVLTAQSGVDVIVNAMRGGAADFIVKPASAERLQVSIENTLKIKGLAGQVSRLTRKISGELNFEDLIGESAAMKAVIDLARRAADSNIPILIEGESGSGKEIIARAIQGSSERAGRPLITVNCGAIPENLVESILFGHERGSFTGASAKHVGKFQEADGGTIFLDEIGELRLDMQVKLLRALQDGEIDPIGAKRPIKVDVRLISATNKNLQQMVDDNAFREDLFYRLNVFPVQMPALRARPEDTGPLGEHFLANFAATEGKHVRSISEDAQNMLRAYDWPGNVRQLENAIFRAVVLCDGEVLEIRDFPQIAQAMGYALSQPGGALPGVQAAPAVGQTSGGGHSVSVLNGEGEVRSLEEIEGAVIRLAIEHYSGQMSEVARRLGIGRSTLYRKVRELDIEQPRKA